jgi:RNA polymerase sigma factor (sigma-70 family)
MPMERNSPERLLDHGHFLRGLAAALVRNPADADDVVQGAYAAALTKAPPAGWYLPQWLAGVTRNLARRSVRDRVRRQAREQAVVRCEAVRATDEVVELEELRHRVVQAVLALDDPYRSAVLMRFYDGLEPGEIAKRQGVPAATVRSHLHRAVQQLRGRLDREQRPDRRPWTAVLLPFVAQMAPAAATPAGSSAFAKLGVAATLAVAVLIAYPFVFPADPAVAGVPSPAPVVSEAASAVVGAQPNERRDAVAAAPEVPVPAPPTAMLRFVEPGGLTIAGEDLRARFAAAQTAMAVTMLDNRALEQKGVEGMLATLVGDPTLWCTAGMVRVFDGGVEVTNLPTAGQVRLLVARPGAPAFLSPVCVLPLAKSVAFDVLLAPQQSTRLVRFVASDTGAALADASVSVYTEFGDDRAYVKGTTVRTDARGECRLADDNLPQPLLIRPAVFWLETPTHAGRFTIGNDAAVQEVKVMPRGQIEGVAFDLTGAPARECVVAFVSNKGPLVRVRTDAAGHFVAPMVPATRTLVMMLGNSATEFVNAEVSVPSADTVTMQLGSASVGAQVSGLLTTHGQPLAGVLVMARARRDSQRMAKTDADGGYTLRGVAKGARLGVFLGDLSVSDNFTIGGDEPLELAESEMRVLNFDLPGGTIAVSVLDDATGEPLSGVAVIATPKGDNVQADRFPNFSYRAGWAEATDGAGAATLRCLPEGEPHTIRIGGRGFVQQVIEVPQPSLEAAPKAIVVRVSRKG